MKVIKEIRISDNGFVFNSNSGDSFVVNPTGLKILRLISQNMEFEEIREQITSLFDVEEITFEKDFYEFCSLLRLYEIIDSDGGPEFK